MSPVPATFAVTYGFADPQAQTADEVLDSIESGREVTHIARMSCGCPRCNAVLGVVAIHEQEV